MIGTGHPEYDYTMTTDERITELEGTNAEKAMCVYIDDELKFQGHIQPSASKAKRIFWVIRRSYTYLYMNSLVYLYRRTIRPVLEFSLAVWTPLRQMDIDAVESVQ